MDQPSSTSSPAAASWTASNSPATSGRDRGGNEASGLGDAGDMSNVTPSVSIASSPSDDEVCLGAGGYLRKTKS